MEDIYFLKILKDLKNKKNYNPRMCRCNSFINFLLCNYKLDIKSNEACFPENLRNTLSNADLKSRGRSRWVVLELKGIEQHGGLGPLVCKA